MVLKNNTVKVFCNCRLNVYKSRKRIEIMIINVTEMRNSKNNNY